MTRDPMAPAAMLSNLSPRHRLILLAALDAVEPAHAVATALHLEGATLHVGEATINMARVKRVIVLGAGKAGAPMVQAVEALLGNRVTAGMVVVKDGHGAPTARVEVREAGHPVPTQAGLDAGAALLALARTVGPDDLVICLLSGGGSALLEALPAPLTLADLQATTALLLASGASINEMNTVRKHLSLVKGGRLAQVVAPARLVTLVLSDVVGSPLDVIASGPTVADPSTWLDAWGVIERYALAERLPQPVAERLRAGLDGHLVDTPKAGDAAFTRTTNVIVGDNARAAAAACAAATAAGYHAAILTTFLEGEAREIARVAVALAREVQAYNRPVAEPACLILGGETTVTLGEKQGRGGRNQEIALAAAIALEGTHDITVIALATDGTDGPTDAAGGWADGATAARARTLGLDLHGARSNHDAYPLLAATHALLRTGPTRTNVNDLLFIFVE